MINHIRDYIERQAAAIVKSPYGKLEEFCEMLMEARESGSTIYFAGNGGSAATASIFVKDLVKGLSPNNKKRFRAFSLSDQLSVITSIANDYDYSIIFAEQLKNHGNPGDLLVVLSGSGNDPNIVKACETAKEKEMKIAAFTGRDGGEIAKMCDLVVIAPVNNLHRIDDIHMLWENCVITTLREEIDKEQ